ncbi:MAG: transcriptional repressor [Flavobacteriales bacterium]|nr:transcriptional repressor [Flavobacteriales bacterium]
MNHLDKILKKHNVKPTAMRLLVLQFISNKNIAVSLTDIENNYEKSERTTLYRSLQTFVENNIAHKIDDGTGVTKYAICAENCCCSIQEDLHIHFHCRICNETTCLTEYKIPTLNLPTSLSAEEINLVVKGVCNNCSKK